MSLLVLLQSIVADLYVPQMKCNGPSIAVFEKANDPRILEELNPNKRDVGAVSIMLPFTKEELQTLNKLMRANPCVENRVRVRSQPIILEDEQIEADNEWAPRWRNTHHPHYSADRDVPEVRQYWIKLLDQWLEKDLIAPALHAVLHGGMLQSSLFETRQPGTFGMTGYLNATKDYVAVTPMHCESGDMLGINVMLHGKAVWFVLHPTEENHKRLREAYASLEGNIGEPRLYDGDGKFIVSMMDIMDFQVMLSRVTQVAGMVVITKAGGAHAVFSDPNSCKMARNGLVDLPALRGWVDKWKRGLLTEGEIHKLTYFGFNDCVDLEQVLWDLQLNKESYFKWWPQEWSSEMQRQ